MRDILTKLGDIASKALAAAYGLFVLWALFNQSVIGSAAFLLAGVLCYPDSRRQITSRIGQDYRKLPLVAAVIALSLIGMMANSISASIVENDRRIAEGAKLQAERAETEKAAQAVRNVAFSRGKEQVLAAARALCAEGKFSEAKAELAKYTADDSDLRAAQKVAEVGDIKSKLEGSTALAVSERLQLLSRLVELEPANTEAEKDRKELQAAIETQKANEAAAAARQAQVDRQFSAWDGSHRNVEAAIKERMNDPDSYKHVKTAYKDTPAGLIVITKFRGTNKFGAVVTTTAIAKVDSAGNVLSLDIE